MNEENKEKWDSKLRKAKSMMEKGLLSEEQFQEIQNEVMIAMGQTKESTSKPIADPTADPAELNTKPNKPQVSLLKHAGKDNFKEQSQEASTISEDNEVNFQPETSETSSLENVMEENNALSREMSENLEIETSNDPTEEDTEKGNKYKEYFTPNRSGGAGSFFLSLVSITWLIAIVLMGIALPLSGTTVILLYILSAVVFLCCPCFGALGAAATTSILMFGLSFCAMMATLASIIGFGLSGVAVITSLKDKDTLMLSGIYFVGHIILLGILFATGIGEFGLSMFEFLIQ